MIDQLFFGQSPNSLKTFFQAASCYLPVYVDLTASETIDQTASPNC